MAYDRPRLLVPFLLLLLASAVLAACGGGDKKACDLGSGTGCDEGLVCRATAEGEPVCTCSPIADTGCEDAAQVCEEVQDGVPGCFAPVVVRGEVFDLSSGGAVDGARIVALDVNGAPVSKVAVSGADGSYELAIPSVRNVDGAPVGVQITLRADAAGYQTFPSGVRQALPVDTGAPTMVDGRYVIESVQTEIGLIPLPAGAGTGRIHGKVEVTAESTGVLVVAETPSGTGTATGATAIADRDGDYVIFNLPAASYTVKGYARGASYTTVTADVPAGGDVAVDLDLADEATATVSGKVEIVNPGAGQGTSVILVVESTFNENLARGESPPGLRAPATGVPSVTGDFVIEGVPAGRYVILAAFENDFLVRDPDTCIAGTAIVRREILPGENAVLDQSFKVTGALDVIAPGASGPEAVTAAPTLTWVDDSSEDEYRIRVFDAFGDEVWATTIAGTSGGDPSVTYGGPLDPGMYYQFRVTSVRINPNATCEISQTEDLKGVFYVP